MTAHKKWIAVLFAGVALTGQAQAADITPQGAEELKSSLTYFLPKDIVDTGFLKVNPDTGRYEIVTDLNVLINKFKDPSFTINGLTPLSMFAAPKDGGLWQVDSSWPVNVNGTIKNADKTKDFEYAIASASYVFTGVFDQSIHYFTSGTTTAKDIKWHTKEGETEASVTFADVNSTMTGTKTPAGALDLTSVADMSNMTETLTDPSAGPVEIKIDKVAVKADILSAKLNEIVAILSFVVEHKQKDKLTDEEAKTFKELLKAGMPFWNNLEETVDFNNITVNTAMGSGSLGKLGIGFHMSGATNDADFGFSTSIENPVLPEGILPPAYVAAIPSEASIDVEMPNFHVADAATMMIDKIDFNNATAKNTPEEDAALGKAVLGGDTMHVVLNKMTAKSDIYDLELSGDMTVNVNEKEKVAAAMTLLARDLDKTVEFLQKNADTVPEYGQAAFFAQMFKGFAVQNDDGRQKWVVEMAEDNSIKINGTPFGMPK